MLLSDLSVGQIEARVEHYWNKEVVRGPGAEFGLKQDFVERIAMDLSKFCSHLEDHCVEYNNDAVRGPGQGAHA